MSKKGDMVSQLKPYAFKDGKWTYKEALPVKVVGEFETYLICRHPRCAPFLIPKKKAIKK